MLCSQGVAFRTSKCCNGYGKKKEGKLQMLLLPRQNGPDSLFKEVRVFKGVENRKAETGYERVPKVFWTQGAKVSQESLAPSETCFAQVQPDFAPVQEAFRSLGPNDLLHLLVTTFESFLFSTSSPKRLDLQVLGKGMAGITTMSSSDFEVFGTGHSKPAMNVVSPNTVPTFEGNVHTTKCQKKKCPTKETENYPKTAPKALRRQIFGHVSDIFGPYFQDCPSAVHSL